MYKHPISAFFRLLPPVAWAVACVISLVMPLRLYLYLRTEGAWGDMTKAWPTAVVLLGIVAVGIYSARMAYKEYKEMLPGLLADKPLLPPFPKRPRPQQFTPTRYPLSDQLRGELRRVIEILQGAGMLTPGEVTIEHVIDRAETFDEWTEVDLYTAMVVLEVLSRERRQPFANLAFFLTDIEADESHAVNIVRELARLCGRLQQLGAVRVRAISGGKIVPAGSLSAPPNAVAEFELDTQRHSVPFVFYGKLLPGGLIEALTKILPPAEDPRRFVWDNFDSFFAVSYLTPAQTVTVNGAEQAKFPRFEEVR